MSAASISFPRAADAPVVLPPRVTPEQIVRDYFDLMVQMSSVIDSLQRRVKTLEALAGPRNVRRMAAHLKGQVQ